MMTEPQMMQRLCDESAEFARLCQETKAQAARTLSKLPRVLACGLLKAGKSSLLNALTGNLAHEFFATKASRSTTQVAELTVAEVTYVDTPGLDACAADDQEAWRGLEGADQLLFVHDLRVAALDVMEAAFLKELQRRRPDVQRQLLVVLTHAESAATDVDARLADLGVSLKKVLGFRPTMVCTSFTRHRKGVLEHKPTLVAKSGMADVLAHLSHLRHQNDWLASRSVRQTCRQQQLAALVTQATSQRQHELQGLQQARAQLFGYLHNDFGNFLGCLRERLASYERI